MDAVVTPVVDVSELPASALGERAPLWWGVLLMVVIEGTMFAVMLGSYLYLRNETAEWPPLGTAPPDQLPAALTTAALVASLLPQWLADRLACEPEPNQAAVRWMLVLATVLGVVVLVPRAFEFPALHCQWDSHAYGSITWTLLGMHTLHVLTSTVETGVLAVYLFFRELDDKHRLDANANSLYWYFIVASWMPVYALVYFGPVLL
jgi:cytochrome c oxidase subunit I+III